MKRIYQLIKGYLTSTYTVPTRCKSRCDTILLSFKSRIKNSLNRILKTYVSVLYKWPSCFLLFGLCLYVVTVLPANGIDLSNLVDETEVLISPSVSKSVFQRRYLHQIFNFDEFNFYSHQQIDLGSDLIVIYKTEDDVDLLNLTLPVLDDIMKIHDFIMNNITITENGSIYRYSDLCATKEGRCSVQGDFVFGEAFKQIVNDNNFSYSMFGNEALSDTLAIKCLSREQSRLAQCPALKLRYNLRSDINTKYMSSRWIKSAIDQVDDVNSAENLSSFTEKCNTCSSNISIFMMSSKLSRDDVHSDFNSIDMTLMLIPFGFVVGFLICCMRIRGLIFCILTITSTWSVISYMRYENVTMMVVVAVFIIMKQFPYLVQTGKIEEEDDLKNLIQDMLKGNVFIMIFIAGVFSEFYIVRLVSITFCVATLIMPMIFLFVTWPIYVLECKYIKFLEEPRYFSCSSPCLWYCLLLCCNLIYALYLIVGGFGIFYTDLNEEQSPIYYWVYSERTNHTKSKTRNESEKDSELNGSQSWKRLKYIMFLLYTAYLGLATYGIIRGHITPTLCDLSNPHNTSYRKFCSLDESLFDSGVWASLNIKHKTPFYFNTAFAETSKIMAKVREAGISKTNQTISSMSEYNSMPNNQSFSSFVRNQTLYINDVSFTPDVKLSRIYFKTSDLSTTDKIITLIKRLRDLEETFDFDFFFYAREFPLFEGYLSSGVDVTKTFGIAGCVFLIIVITASNSSLLRTLITIFIPLMSCFLGTVGLLLLTSLPLTYLYAIPILLIFSVVAELSISGNGHHGLFITSVVYWCWGLFGMAFLAMTIPYARRYVLKAIFLPQIIFGVISFFHFKIVVPILFDPLCKLITNYLQTTMNQLTTLNQQTTINQQTRGISDTMERGLTGVREHGNQGRESGRD